MIAVNQIATASNLDIGVGSGKWGVGSGERYLFPTPHSPLPTSHSMDHHRRLNLQRSRLVGYRTVERKIGLRIGLLGHFDLRGLRAVLLVPGFNLVLARRQALDRERSACVADCEKRMREHRDVSFHPGMLVAFDRENATSIPG